MDFLHDNIRSLYARYLAAAFGSAFIASVYSIIDMAVVGLYQGPSGTAALAVVAPVWNIIFSLGLLMGIGGGVLFSNLRGRGAAKAGAENAYFTASTLGSVFIALAAWAALLLREETLLRFFGADDALLPLAHEYLKPIRYVFPLFLFNQQLAAFLRNDGSPGLTTASVLGGGLVNAVGDYVFVFPLGMGVYGAGLATALGGVVTFLGLLVHFFRRHNTLALVRVPQLGRKLGAIVVTGFSTFFVDVAMGILTILFNRQIMTYLGVDALAVYGPIINVSTFVQGCAYSVGQAAQPLISTNYGARQGDRVRATLRCALLTCGVLSLAWTALSLLFPLLYVRLFMTPTESVLRIAPDIIRAYSLSFLLLPLNIFSTYYFQSLMKPRAGFIVSVGRGLVISGALILLLPLVTPGALWFAMPVTELFTAFYVVFAMRRYTRALPHDIELPRAV